VPLIDKSKKNLKSDIILMHPCMDALPNSFGVID